MQPKRISSEFISFNWIWAGRIEGTGQLDTMFSQMFDTCLENSTVTVIKQLDNNSQEQRLNTLGELARTTEFIHFYVMSSSTQPNLTFIEALQHLISTRNNNQSATKKKPQNNNSPAKFKRIFGLSGLGKKPSNNNAGFMTTMEVVVVDVEFTPNQSNLSFVSECGFYFFPTQMYLTKSRLLRALGFVNAPSLFVVETAGLNVQSQAYRTLLDDRDGLQFPWPNPPLAELFKTEILRNSPDDGSIVKVDFTTLGKGVKGLFFGAKWCPPSRAMCKQLCEIYPELKNEHQSFEIIFCSSDRSEESFRDHFSSMPWFALPFGCEKQFSKAYDVQGIPTFLLLNDDFSLISRNGLHLLLSEPQNYPWKRKAIYELNEFTAQRLSELPALILFTEGSPEDTDFSIQFLESCADWIHNSPTQQKEQTADTGHTSAETASLGSEKPISLSVAADPLQIFYTGEDPICDYVLDSLGQEQADLPLLLICDVMAGHMVICEKPDVSEQVLSAFVADYRAGRAKVQPIPSPKQNQSRTVAGIPADMLQQMVSQEQLQTLPQPAESA